MTQITRKDALELKSRLDEFHLNSEIELCAPWGVADVEQIERHHRFIENDPLLWPMLYPRTQCKALAFDLGGAIIKRFFPAVSIGDRYEYYLMCRLIDAGIPQIQLDAHAIKHTPLRTTFLWRGALLSMTKHPSACGLNRL